MTLNLIEKAVRYFWARAVSFSRNKIFYPLLYGCYWHSIIFKQNDSKNETHQYFSSNPNPGAGIGHQMANWIAGYWFAKEFELLFAHIPFSSESWERFLGFGENEESIANLVLNEGYKKIRIPFFGENNENEINRIRKIIDSYRNQKVIFICEQDQFYKNQYGVMDGIKAKFYGSKSRKFDQIIYDKKNFNIAIHVRRGDIVMNRDNNNPNLQMRWQDSVYFEKVLTKVVSEMITGKPLAIYLFSQGNRKDFSEFEKFIGLHYCLDMNAQESFLHMVHADMLITSKSSFSYKPALLSNGIKICPRDFWHGYPETNDWILADPKGNFKIKHFEKSMDE